MAGSVFSGERKLAKAGEMLAEDAALEVRGKDHPWVSRGGIKLDHGLTHFGFDVSGAVALDVGSSTGGFTDVLLSKGDAHLLAGELNDLGLKSVTIRTPNFSGAEKFHAGLETYQLEVRRSRRKGLLKPPVQQIKERELVPSPGFAHEIDQGDGQ